MLRIGVSLAAIALAAPALAADLVVKAPVPAADQGEFRAFVEGGAFWTAGNAIPYTAPGLEIFGATSILPLANGGNGATNVSLRPRVGWDAAVGFDYRFAGTPWHVNMQARWGEARGSAAISAPRLARRAFKLRNAVTRQLAFSPQIAEAPVASAIPRQNSRKATGMPISGWDMILSPV